jgi:hypothetical protein
LGGGYGAYTAGTSAKLDKNTKTQVTDPYARVQQGMGLQDNNIINDIKKFAQTVQGNNNGTVNAGPGGRGGKKTQPGTQPITTPVTQPTTSSTMNEVQQMVSQGYKTSVSQHYVEVKNVQNSILKAAQDEAAGRTPQLPSVINNTTANDVFGSHTAAMVALGDDYTFDSSMQVWKFTGSNGVASMNGQSQEWYRAVLANIPTVPTSYGRYGAGPSSGGGNGGGGSAAVSVIGWRSATG